jgi:hypothetical protein
MTGRYSTGLTDEGSATGSLTQSHEDKLHQSQKPAGNMLPPFTFGNNHDNNMPVFENI